MPDWTDRAAGRGADTELFYPLSELHAATVAKATKVCRECPVIDACHADALDRGERFGIWGGTTPQERRRLRRALRRAHRRVSA